MRQDGTPGDPLYRAILLLLALDVVAGAVLMVLGHYRVVAPALGEVGTWLGILGGTLYLLLRWWGRRRARQGGGEDGGEGEGGRP